MRCVVYVTSVPFVHTKTISRSFQKNSTLGTVFENLRVWCPKTPFVWTRSVSKISGYLGGVSVARVYHVLSINRCNCVALVDGVSDHAASKVWEQRWVRACVCGGSWKRLPFREPQTVTHTTVTE